MLKIEKAILVGFLVAVIAMMTANFSAFAAQSSDIRQKVFRLHILANSDSKADQSLKLHVRDRILEKSATLFQYADNKVQVISEARTALPQIEAIARDEIHREGYTYPVKARIVHMYFNTRVYGNVTLPAGDYDALRITIGAAKGHNWWCVLFPPLCLPSAEGEEKLAENLTPTEDQTVKQGSQPQIQVKFKTLELWESLKGTVSSWFSK
ncbi:MAG: stage II sporulation protein R [Ethanoligenens sp.]